MIFTFLKKVVLGNPLVVLWLGLQALIAEGTSSIPGRDWTKIPQAAWCGKKKKKEKKKSCL